jgi:N-carbamoylputrescine amidase
LPVLVANRVGHEPDGAAQGNGITFWGGSFIAGQQGELLAEADAESAGYLVADLDLGRTDKLRRIWPYFRDRRIDAYDGLTSRMLKP